MKFYIDPGTGSMLFAILIGVIGALNYVIRIFIVKIRFWLSGGKKNQISEGKIPYVIFCENKRYWTIFEPICREFERRQIDVVYLTASLEDPALKTNFEYVKTEFIGEDNKAFAKLNFLKASVLLSTTPGLDVYQWKRSRDVDCYVHIFHAPGEVLLYRMFGMDYYDAILCGGKFQMDDIRKLEELRHLPAKDLPIGGIPYMDEMVKRIKATPRPKNTVRTVLLAPSWGPSAILNVYGSSIIDKLLETGYHIIIRPHPQSFTSEKELMDKLMSQYPDSDQLEWNRDADNFDVLNRSDILISDFSGVTFEFALCFDKPIIYTDTKFDRAPYDAWWLPDHELWLDGALKRLGMLLTPEHINKIKEQIDTCIDDPSYTQSRQEVIHECWQEYGNGAVATVDYLVQKFEQLTNKKQ